MDDVEREAQERGYGDGSYGKSANPDKWNYRKYSNLLLAYNRGHAQGLRDYERHMKQVAQ